MRVLPTSGGPQQDGLAVDDEPAPGDLAHLCPVDRRLRAKVEACQVAREGEAHQTATHVDATLVAPGDLTLTEQRQVSTDRKIDSPANVVLAALSFVDAGGEALRDAEAVLDFAQGEQPAVGAQVPGIEPGDDRLAADR